MTVFLTFRFTLDLNALTISEHLQFKEQIIIYKQIAPVIREGDLYRLWSPFKVPYAAWMYVSQDKSEAVVFAFSLNSDHWSNLVPRLMLRGLRPDAEYEVSEPLPNNVQQQADNLKIIETIGPVYQLGYQTVFFTGEILMSAGLPLRFYTLDDSIMFLLKAVRKRPSRHPSI
jgi:hypothetical protein